MTLKYYISGNVQHVHFREFIHNLCDMLDITGYVTNEADYVELVMSAELPKIEYVLKAIKTRYPTQIIFISDQENIYRNFNII